MVFSWLPLAIAAADLTALKTGLLEHPPEILAALVGIAMVALLIRGVVRGIALVRDRRPVAGAELLVIIGLLTALGAGTANWLLGLQGFIVLYEGEQVPLSGGSHLQELVGGPMARVEEMEMAIGLQEVELVPEGEGRARTFIPRSHLVVVRSAGGLDEEVERLEVEPRRLAAAGPLRFHQGVFGFAPRIGIEKGGEAVFDRVVPFTTEKAATVEGTRGVAFEGAFTLEREALRVDGQVDLASLDAGLRGHATLDLVVRRLGEDGEGGEVLGRGRLLPGHFAEIGDGYRIGFVDLKKWSEILVSRRGYGDLLLGGVCVALVGLVALPFSRRWGR